MIKSPQQEAILAWFRKDRNFFDTHSVFVDVDGHLVGIARAGVGKTTVIIWGVKVAPERSILIAAFSKLIQLTLEKKIREQEPGQPFLDTSHIKALTLHSVGFSAVRKFRDNIKVEFGSLRADTLTEAVCGRHVPDTIKRLVSKLHTKAREIAPHAKFPGELIDIAIKFECEPEQEWANSGFPLEKVESYALAAMELAADVKSGDTIDGSDMIFLPVRNGWLYPQYDLVVIDEAQDMTTAQLEVAQGVLRPGGRIAVIGDNRQAIFGFRGADSESLDRLSVELNAGRLGLTTTYRCARAIVGIAQHYVPDFEAGPNNPEGEILNIPSVDLVPQAGPGDFILSRVNAPLVSIAMKLLKAGKRTQIAGKDIGKGLIALVRKFKARSVPDFLQKVAMWETRETTRLEGMLAKAEERRKQTIRSKMGDIVDQAEMLTSLAEDAKNVDSIINKITDLFTDDGLGAEGMITCSSVHKAKGLEAKKVFILEDTLRNYSIEEQNICYVAITRAKETLVWVSDNR